MHQYHRYFAVQDAPLHRENLDCPDIAPIRCLLRAMLQNIVYEPTKVMRINATTECVLLVNSVRLLRVQ